MNESRQAQYEPIADPDQCAEKWRPLTRGIDEKVACHMAWAMEREAKYLHHLTQRDGDVVGPVLKFIFPTIRLTISGFSVLDRVAVLDDKEALAGVFQYQVERACEALVEEMRQNGRDVESPEDFLNHHVFSGLGARLADYTLSYPRLT